MECARLPTFGKQIEMAYTEISADKNYDAIRRWLAVDGRQLVLHCLERERLQQPTTRESRHGNDADVEQPLNVDRSHRKQASKRKPAASGKC